LARLLRLLLPLVAAAAALLALAAPAGNAAPVMPYAAVGDSITSMAQTAPGGWVGRYAASINTAMDVDTSVTNLGVYGATAAQLKTMLQQDGDAQVAIAGSGVVTIEAGTNDFFGARALYLFNACGGADNQDCLRSMVTSFASTWDGLVSQVHALAPAAAIRVMTIYYAAAGYDQSTGAFAVLNPYLSQLNAHIMATPGARIADVHAAFNGADGTADPYAAGYLLDDDVHPNWLGQILIVIQLRNLGYDDIAAPAPAVGGIAVTPDLAAVGGPGPSATASMLRVAAMAFALVAMACLAWRARWHRPKRG
jgi:lysophospholipase L1-like esterase